jgi:hypothetical protein
VRDRHLDAVRDGRRSRGRARREDARAGVVVGKTLERLEAAEHLVAVPAAHLALLQVQLARRHAEAREAMRAGGDQHGAVTGARPR